MVMIEETGNVKVFIDELDGVPYLNFETKDAGYSVTISNLYKYLALYRESVKYKPNVDLKEVYEGKYDTHDIYFNGNPRIR